MIITFDLGAGFFFTNKGLEVSMGGAKFNAEFMGDRGGKSCFIIEMSGRSISPSDEFQLL